VPAVPRYSKGGGTAGRALRPGQEEQLGAAGVVGPGGHAAAAQRRVSLTPIIAAVAAPGPSRAHGRRAHGSGGSWPPDWLRERPNRLYQRHQPRGLIDTSQRVLPEPSRPSSAHRKPIAQQRARISGMRSLPLRWSPFRAHLSACTSSMGGYNYMSSLGKTAPGAHVLLAGATVCARGCRQPFPVQTWASALGRQLGGRRLARCDGGHCVTAWKQQQWPPWQ